MLLEANARPGLAIQIANGRGLIPALEEIDARLNRKAVFLPMEALRQKRVQERIGQSA
jgi:hypothetical protein